MIASMFKILLRLVNITLKSKDYGTSYQTIDMFPLRCIKILLEYQQQEQILQFLMGLNQPFAHVRGQILLMDPLPRLNKVYSLILRRSNCDQFPLPTLIISS